MTAADVDLHPLVAAAGGDGRLPDWARCSEGRRQHLSRVRELMDRWAERLELPGPERVRWRAAATLHDALRDADPEELRFWSDRDWPEPVLHAPACAARLRDEGVEDRELLRAVAYHPVGHPDLEDVGAYLYLADFLDPGRDFLNDVRERLRALLPEDRDEALRSVAALRIAHLLEIRGPILCETVRFWNRLLEEEEET